MKDLKELIDLGMDVTATGGISYESLDILAELPLYAIICGKSVLKAGYPAAEAERIKNRMMKLW